MSVRSCGASKEQRIPAFASEILAVNAISIGVAGYLDKFSGSWKKHDVHEIVVALESCRCPRFNFLPTTAHGRVRPICYTPGANYDFKKIQRM
jgi:hypothetical protein